MHTRVLVVDDEPDLLELVHYNLTKAGYDVACVTSGAEALSHVRLHTPDLIVLDVLLPDIDGLEVCKALRRNPQTGAIPIMMLTARSEDADIVAGLELGADDYLTKPFSPRVLLARIKAVLRRQQTDANAEDGCSRAIRSSMPCVAKTPRLPNALWTSTSQPYGVSSATIASSSRRSAGLATALKLHDPYPSWRNADLFFTPG